MTRVHKFECVDCKHSFSVGLNTSGEVGACPQCKSADLVVRQEYGEGAEYAILYSGNPLKLEKRFRCNDCQEEFTVIARNLVRNHEKICLCGSKNVSRVVESKSRTFAMPGTKNWLEGKSPNEIADYIVPDENGKYKDPY